jgi:hypothetical protein
MMAGSTRSSVQRLQRHGEAPKQEGQFESKDFRPGLGGFGEAPAVAASLGLELFNLCLST